MRHATLLSREWGRIVTGNVAVSMPGPIPKRRCLSRQKNETIANNNFRALLLLGPRILNFLQQFLRL